MERTSDSLWSIDESKLQDLQTFLCARARPPTVHPPPHEDLRRAIFELFLASLQVEESRATVGSFVLTSPEACTQHIRLEPIPLTSALIRRLASAASPESSAFGVFNGQVWGIALRPPTGAVMISIVGPGELLIRHGTEVVARFAAGFLEYFENRRERIAEWAARHGAEAELLARLARLSVHMRRLRHGGTVILHRDEALKGVDLTHKVTDVDRFRAVPEVTSAEENAKAEPTSELWKSRAALDVQARAIEDERLFSCLAHLTAVDGALVLNSRFEPVAFGARIRSEEEPRITSVDFPSIEERQLESIAQLGGTRHGSAARCAWANDKALVLVVSQDGAVSLMSSHREGGSEGVVRVSRGIGTDFPVDSLMLGHYVGVSGVAHGRSTAHCSLSI